MITVTLKIPGISCNHCVHTIKSEVIEIKGVKSVEVNIDSKIATITYEPPATEDQIKELLKEINYPVA
jgi:copper chaperone